MMLQSTDSEAVFSCKCCNIIVILFNGLNTEIITTIVPQKEAHTICNNEWHVTYTGATQPCVLLYLGFRSTIHDLIVDREQILNEKSHNLLLTDKKMTNHD